MSHISFFSLVTDRIIDPFGIARAYREAFELLNEVLLLGNNCTKNGQESECRVGACIVKCERIISSSFY